MTGVIWLDILVMAVGLVAVPYVLYFVDRNYTHKGSSESNIIAHFRRTGFFPTRAMGYDAGVGLILSFLNAGARTQVPGSSGWVTLTAITEFFVPAFALMLPVILVTTIVGVIKDA